MSALRGALQRFVEGPQSFATPNVTSAQQLALGQAIVATVATLGFNLDQGTQQLILIVSGILAASLPVSDALVRRARAEHAPEIATARAQQQAKAVVPTPAQMAVLDKLAEELRALTKESGPPAAPNDAHTSP